IQMEGRTIIDTISDNAALGAMVLGGSPVKPEDIDLRWVGGALWRNNEIMETGLSAGILGHPPNGVHWPANRLAGHDDYLEAGEIILAGSFTRYMRVYDGDTVFAALGPLGSIGSQFEQPPLPHTKVAPYGYAPTPIVQNPVHRRSKNPAQPGRRRHVPVIRGCRDRRNRGRRRDGLPPHRC